MPSQVSVENRANLPDHDFVRLAEVVATQRSIKHALDWLAGHQPPLTLSDLVAQDEFSHDILVAYPGALWLVYDTS